MAAPVNKPTSNTLVTAPTEERIAVTEQVRIKIEELQNKGEISIPKNYSPQNALKSAWLTLQEVKDRNGKLAINVCKPQSVHQALFNMVIQGLSPAKKQCYFIAYGDQLTLMRSYLGAIAVTKRLDGIKDVKGYPLYKGDVFETEYDVNTASIKVVKYQPSFDNIDIKAVIGAFAVVIGDNGPIHTEVMTIAQIKTAWNQGATKGNSGAHNNFTEEMAVKSVINRACKRYWNTSDDYDLLDAINSTENEGTKPEYDSNNILSEAEYEVQQEEETTEKVIVEAQIKTEPVQEVIDEEDPSLGVVPF